MKNCLVTELVTSSHNDVQGKLNELVVHVNIPTFNANPCSIGSRIGRNSAQQPEIFYRIQGNGHWCNSSGEADENGTYLSAGDYYVCISNKYEISRIDIIGYTGHMPFDVYGSIDTGVLKYCVEMIFLRYNFKDGIFKMSDLANMNKLTTLYCAAGANPEDETDLISNFVVPQIKAGRTSASINTTFVVSWLKWGTTSIAQYTSIKVLSWSLSGNYYNVSFDNNTHSCKVNKDTYEVSDIV